MTWSRWPKGARPVHRDVTMTSLLVVLRSAVGLSPHDAGPGELAASRGRNLPPSVTEVDAGAWIAWSVVGLVLFSGGRTPTLAEVVAEARRLLLALLMERLGGNITRVARAAGTSRRMVRERLRAAGLYGLDPWFEGDRGEPPAGVPGGDDDGDAPDGAQ